MARLNHEADKLRENIIKHSTDEVAQRIAHGVPLSDPPTDEERIQWVHHVVESLDASFDPPTVRSIRAGCYCNEDGKLEKTIHWLKGLYDASEDIHSFVDKVNERGAGWVLEDGYLYTSYTDCPCPLLDGIDHLSSKAWCYCTVGYNKAIFSHVFGIPFDDVEVSLLKAIKMGDDCCLLRINAKELPTKCVSNWMQDGEPKA